MPFGEIVSVLRADLQPLEQDLKKAEERIRAYLLRVNRLHAQVSSGGAMAGFAAGGRLPVIGAGGSAAQAADRTVAAAERASRRMYQLNVQAEAEYRRLLASRDSAYKEDERRRVAAAKRAADAEKRIAEQARAFYRRQSSLSAPGGGIGGGPGSFITPAHLRGLDEVNSKWLKNQQEIAKAQAAVGGLDKQLVTLGRKTVADLGDRFKTVAGIVAGVGAGALLGGLVAAGKAALDVDRAYQVGRIALAETLSLTTDLVDRHGKLVSASRQMTENYAVSARLYQQIRVEAIKTTLTTGELLTNTEQSMAFLIRGGATVQQVVPLVAQISNLAKSLGARGEREQGFEIKALTTGQMLTRSRIGRALGLSKEDITQARDTGKLVEYLSGVLAKGKPYLDDYAHSFDGIVSTLQSKSQELLRQGTEKTFEKLTASLGDLNKRFDERTITDWANRISEVLAQTAERLNTLANLPVWQSLQRNFAFLVFDQGEATDRDLARRRAARGPERTAVEMARIQVLRRRDELTAMQAAAAGRALPLAERAGAGPKLISHFISPDDQRDIALQQRMLDRDIQRQKAAEEALTRAHLANELKRAAATGENLKRVSRLRTEADLKAKQEAEDERISTAKQLAELRDDKTAQLRAEAEEQIRKVNDDVKSESNRAALIKAIRTKLASDVAEERRRERDDLAESRLKERQLIAQAAGDQLKQIELRNVAELQSRIKEIEADKQVTDKRRAIQRAYNAERLKNEREVNEKIREFQTRGRDLQRQAFDAQANFHKARVTAEREYQQLQQRTAKELRDMIRERRDAEQQLQRARIDRALQQPRLFGSPAQIEPGRFLPGAQDLLRGGMISGTEVPGGVRTFPRVTQAAQPAFVEEQQAIRQSAQQLFGGNVGSLLQAELLRQGLSPDLAQARSERQLRELTEAAQRPGGTQDVLEQLQQSGVRSVTPEFRSGLESIETRATRLQGREDEAAQQQEVERVRREKEDAGKQIQEAQRRLAELDQRQAEVLDGYKAQATALRQDFSKSVVDTSASLRKLNEEVQRLAQTLRASHLPVPSPVVHLLQQSQAGGRVVQGAGAGRDLGGARGQTVTVAGEGTVTNNYLSLNGVDLDKLSGKGSQAVQDLADELLMLSRRTRPTSR